MTKKPAFIIALVLILLIVLMQVSLWRGANSIPGTVTLSHQISAITQTNKKLQMRNQKVYAEIVALRHNAGATEAKAREELGFVKPGEIFYRVVPNKTVKEPQS